jgi:hypothetical protein
MDNKAGYPRPIGDRNGQNTPMPWVGGNYPNEGEWQRVNTFRAIESEEAKLCIVCGLPLPSDFVWMLVQSVMYSDTAGLPVLDELPSPTWVHPKCGKIAATFCPHLKSEMYPALTQNGHKLTHAELTDLARESDKPQENG